MADEDPKVKMALDDIIKLSKPVTQTARRANQGRLKIGGGAKRFSTGTSSGTKFNLQSKVRTIAVLL